VHNVSGRIDKRIRIAVVDDLDYRVTLPVSRRSRIAKLLKNVSAPMLAARLSNFPTFVQGTLGPFRRFANFQLR
jgi:hypothetical protein